jgi:hypothetical protein
MATARETALKLLMENPKWQEDKTAEVITVGGGKSTTAEETVTHQLVGHDDGSTVHPGKPSNGSTMASTSFSIR